MIQLCDINRWNLNIWDIRLADSSVWEWYCVVPVTVVIEALVVQYAGQNGWLVDKDATFNNAINALSNNGVIDKPLKDWLHYWRKFRNQIHLHLKQGGEIDRHLPKAYNEAVRTLQALDAALLYNWDKYSPKPIARFESIWVDYDLDDGYGIGMRIHIGFSVQNLRSKRCQAVAFFYSESDEQLRDFNSRFNTTDGYVAASKDFTPPFDDTIFNDLFLSMPYGELHLATGEHNLKFYIGLYSYDTNSYFAISKWQSFWARWP
jgi:hypothetical protein